MKKKKVRKNKRRTRGVQAVCSLFECALIYDNLRMYEAFLIRHDGTHGRMKKD